MLVVSWALASVTLTTAAGESVTARLARGSSATCLPTLRNFCENIHIGCSGRSAIETFSFVVTANADKASLERTSGDAASNMPPRSGPVEWAENDAYVVVRLAPAHGYLKILFDGSYSYRHYSRGTAYMSYGKCR